MADIKKYMDLLAAQELVAQIKDQDAKNLQSAKDYADSLAVNYDAAGSAATAKAEAIADADAKVQALADGQVKLNKEAIEKLNGDATTEGSVTKAIADAKTVIDGDIDAVEAKADKNAEDIAAINNADTGVLAQAKADAQTKADVVQGNVDAVVAKIGEVPEDKTVKDYIDEKTEGIATDAALGELQEAVDAVEADVATIMGDYLVKADKEALQGAINAEAERAAGVEGGLDTRLKAVEADYLKAADKTELQGNINTLTGVVETLRDGIDAEKVDGVKDLIAYVEEHGTEVTGMKEDIAENAEAINGVAGRATALESAVATKAEAQALADAVSALEGADSAMDARIDAIELQLGDGEGSVADMIADAKQEAIDAAAGDATTKANQALTDAKAYTDSLAGNYATAEQGALADSALQKEDITTGSANGTIAVDGTDVEVKGLGSAAYADTTAFDAAGVAEEKVNTLANGAVADNTAAIAAINNVETGILKQAKDYVDTEVKELADGQVATNTAAITALQTTHAEDKATLQAGIDTNASAIAAFTAVTTDEVKALFA